MKVELCQKVEYTIAREVVKGLLADDFKISMLSGEQTTLGHSTDVATIRTAMFTTGEDQLHVEHQHVAEKGWVLFICSNDGRDVIADHTTNLELSPKSASEPVGKIVDEDPAILVHVLAEVGT